MEMEIEMMSCLVRTENVFRNTFLFFCCFTNDNELFYFLVTKTVDNDSFLSSLCRKSAHYCLKLDFVQIKVRLSERTKHELKLKKKRPNDSILLELPKKTGNSKGNLLKKALVKDLTENKEIVEDFTKACLEIENITFFKEPEIVKTAPELTNLETLETTIIRYFKPTCKKNNLQVDIDLSKGKRLTTEQNDKFFNLQLTKP